MVKSGSFNNLPIAIGFGGLDEASRAETGSSDLDPNRIELRLSKGDSCAAPLISDIRGLGARI